MSHEPADFRIGSTSFEVVKPRAQRKAPIGAALSSRLCIVEHGSGPLHARHLAVEDRRFDSTHIGVARVVLLAEREGVDGFVMNRYTHTWAAEQFATQPQHAAERLDEAT